MKPRLHILSNIFFGVHAANVGKARTALGRGTVLQTDQVTQTAQVTEQDANAASPTFADCVIYKATTSKKAPKFCPPLAPPESSPFHLKGVLKTSAAMSSKEALTHVSLVELDHAAVRHHLASHEVLAKSTLTNRNRVPQLLIQSGKQAILPSSKTERERFTTKSPGAKHALSSEVEKKSKKSKKDSSLLQTDSDDDTEGEVIKDNRKRRRRLPSSRASPKKVKKSDDSSSAENEEEMQLVSIQRRQSNIAKSLRVRQRRRTVYGKVPEIDCLSVIETTDGWVTGKAVESNGSTRPASENELVAALRNSRAGLCELESYIETAQDGATGDVDDSEGQIESGSRMNSDPADIIAAGNPIGEASGAPNSNVGSPAALSSSAEVAGQFGGTGGGGKIVQVLLFWAGLGVVGGVFFTLAEKGRKGQENDVKRDIEDASTNLEEQERLIKTP